MRWVIIGLLLSGCATFRPVDGLTVQEIRQKFPELDFSHAMKCKNMTPWIGMSKRLALNCMGQPYTINRTTSSYGSREQWVYGGGIYSIYIYFENGKVTTIQD